jgi:hypothetical protein
MAMWMVAVCMALTVLVGDCRVVASPAAARQSQGVPWDDVELLGKIDPTLLKHSSRQAGLQPVIVQMKRRRSLNQPLAWGPVRSSSIASLTVHQPTWCAFAAEGVGPRRMSSRCGYTP